MNISVIIPAHNAADTIAETIASLRAQLFSNWEAIIVDDGSSDETASIALKLAEQDGRIHVLSQPQAGVSAARNYGIAQSQYEWLLFLDADDWLAPGHLEKMMAALTADPTLDAVHCGWTRVAPDGTHVGARFGPPQADLFPVLVRFCPFAIHACVVRRSLVKAAHGFDPSLPPVEDWDLWQRIARTGARFGAISEPLALYRMQLHSATSNHRRFLTNSLRVLVQGHALDPRVPNALPVYRNGMPPSQLSELKYYNVCWHAGQVLGSGEDARSLLNLLKEERAPELYPVTIAESIFESTTIPNCVLPSTWVQLWSEVEQRLIQFLQALETQSCTNLLALRTQKILERLVVEHTTVRPLTIGTTHAIRIEITAALPEVITAAERLHCFIECEGKPLGTVELPVCDGRVSRYVLTDAITAKFSWQILGAFFEHTIYRKLKVKPEPTGFSIWRGALCLCTGLPNKEAFWPQVHERVGWTVFLQEIWGRSDWSDSCFYNPQITCKSAPTRRVENSQLTIEISEELPDVETTSTEIEVILTVGGAAIGSVTIQVKNYRVTAQELRAALTLATGYELCQASVREGLLGQSLNRHSLRARLKTAAKRRNDSISPASEQFLMLCRRTPNIFGTSDSRRAFLPAATAPDLMESASVMNEAVIAAFAEKPQQVIYAPEVIVRSTPSSSPITSPGNEREVTPPEPRIHDRAHFETLFARQPDPWKYTTPYEQSKYEQTLSLLPPAPIERVLELACAEGHFTIQLAPRVNHLLATDISQIALDRTAERCAGMKNIQYQRLDLVRDPLPGRFNLIVCSEVLYYVGGLVELNTVAHKLAEALEPDGYLLIAHANVVVDEPQCTGFDWDDVQFGAKVIGETFASMPSLQLVRELRTPLYRIQLFQLINSNRNSSPAYSPQIIELVEQPALPSPEVAAHILWHGGQPQPREMPTVVTHRLPILMYHRVTPTGSTAMARYRVTPEAFEKQLQYLHEAGYYSIKLEEWRMAVFTRRPLPGRAILLTFDDGHQDFLTNAWPLLQHYGFTATVFLVADHIGRTSAWDRIYEEELPLLGWDAIRELQAAGVEFGSHSATHRHLTGLSFAELVREAVLSRTSLERKLSQPVRTFAYPYGDEDRIVQHLIGACGYIYGLSCRSGLAGFQHSLLALPRIEITGSDTLQDFIAKLEAY